MGLFDFLFRNNKRELPVNEDDDVLLKDFEKYKKIWKKRESEFSCPYIFLPIGTNKTELKKILSENNVKYDEPYKKIFPDTNIKYDELIKNCSIDCFVNIPVPSHDTTFQFKGVRMKLHTSFNKESRIEMQFINDPGEGDDLQSLFYFFKQCGWYPYKEHYYEELILKIHGVKPTSDSRYKIDRIIKPDGSYLLSGLYGPPHEDSSRAYNYTLGIKYDLNGEQKEQAERIQIELAGTFVNEMKIDPMNAKSYLDRGFLKCKLQDHIGAIEDFDKALEIDILYADAYYNRGTSKVSLKNFKGAIADFDKAIEINPMDAKAYYNRGLSMYFLGQKDSGWLDLRKASELGNEKANEFIRIFFN